MANSYTGSQSGQSGLNVTEVDGVPDVFGVTKIIVSNTTLTDNGDGSVTITTGGGGGGGSPGGGVGTVQYNDGGSFGGVTGVTSTGANVTYATGTIQVTDISDESGNIFLTPSASGNTLSLGAGLGVATILVAGGGLPLKLYGDAPNGIVVGSGGDNAVIAGSNTYDLTLTTDTEGGGQTSNLTVGNGANANITVAPHGTGFTVFQGGTVAKLTSGGAYAMRLDTNGGTNTAYMELGSGVGENSEISATESGSLIMSVNGTQAATVASHSAGAASLKNNAFVEEVSSDATLAIGQSGGILYNTDGNTLTLPDATAAYVGWQACIIAANGAVTINRTDNTQTLNGSSTNLAITTEKAATLICVGLDQWWLFGSFS